MPKKDIESTLHTLLDDTQAQSHTNEDDTTRYSPALLNNEALRTAVAAARSNTELMRFSGFVLYQAGVLIGKGQTHKEAIRNGTELLDGNQSAQLLKLDNGRVVGYPETR